MRIVVWGINYSPEVTGIAPYNTGLCRWLASRGHEVHMVTTFAYYPQWRKAPGDRGRLYRDEPDGAGVQVHRCWHYVPPQPSTLRRVVHEFSFALTSLLRICALPRADAYVVVSPPLVLGVFAWLATRLKRSRYWFHVQDLQPDAALGLGMVKPGLFTRSLFALEAFAYRHAAVVSGISQGMLDAFARKGVPASKIYYFPNWVSDKTSEASSASKPDDFRRAHGIAPHAFLAVYSGNVGNKQGLGVLLDAALLLARDPPHATQPIEIIIAGDGAARASLEARHAELGLRNVRLMPLLADADYRAMLHSANLALITQEKGTGQFFFPSKLLTVLRAGLIVLAVADDDSELARALSQNRCGFVVPPAHPAALATVLREITAKPSEELKQIRDRGREFTTTFSARFVLPAFETRLKILLAESAAKKIQDTSLLR
jgi:colanic acid biosynthesis glycosyl transferase WcaI